MSEFDDTSHETWLASIAGHRVLSVEYESMRFMHSLLGSKAWSTKPPDVRFGLAYQQIYGASEYSAAVIDRQFRSSASRVRIQNAGLVAEFAGPFALRLKAESRVDHTCSGTSLLRIAFEKDGQDVIAYQRRVEAVPRYIMARLLTAVGHIESEVDVDQRHADVLEMLIKRLFVPGKSAKVDLLAQFDRERNHCLAAVIVPVGERVDWPRVGKVRCFETACRYVNIAGQPVMAVLDDRVKDDFSTVLRVLRRGTPIEKYGHVDKCGLTLVVADREDLWRVDQVFSEAMRQPPFSVRQRSDNLVEQGRTVDADNPDTVTSFRAIRYALDFADPAFPGADPCPVEANLQLAAHYADAHYARTEANHHAYKLRQLARLYFRLRFPAFIFKIDFRAGSADYQRMMEFVLS
jgi:hypothetical protein